MRTFALALAALLAPSVLAQPVLTDSSDTYVSPLFGIGSSGGGRTAFLVGADVGRRVAPSVDLGARVIGGDLTYGDGGAFLTVGPTLGTTRRLGAGVELDARLLGTATFADLGPRVGDDGFGLRRIQGTGQVSLSRPLRVVGSLRLAPTVGAYGTACRVIGYEVTGAALRCAEAGALAGVDVRFRLFGADVSLPVVAPIRLVGNDAAGRLGLFDVSQVPITGGLRVRF
ncbi:hypothetical protein [Rubrivirga sp.]|uniref:hypothetical protein n=1 Tax=Rubrivirga sp. TaxID=1885344 RepID=UPI003B51F55F